MSGRKASDLLVACLEAEGVAYVFGVPGEETVDLNESLSRSTVRFIPTRHEQAAAYMADACSCRVGTKRTVDRDNDSLRLTVSSPGTPNR